jgi:hypothetical protein
MRGFEFKKIDWTDDSLKENPELQAYFLINCLVSAASKYEGFPYDITSPDTQRLDKGRKKGNPEYRDSYGPEAIVKKIIRALRRFEEIKEAQHLDVRSQLQALAFQHSAAAAEDPFEADDDEEGAGLPEGGGGLAAAADKDSPEAIVEKAATELLEVIKGICIEASSEIRKTTGGRTKQTLFGNPKGGSAWAGQLETFLVDFYNYDVPEQTVTPMIQPNSSKNLRASEEGYLITHNGKHIILPEHLSHVAHVAYYCFQESQNPFKRLIENAPPREAVTNALREELIAPHQELLRTLTSDSKLATEKEKAWNDAFIGLDGKTPSFLDAKGLLNHIEQIICAKTAAGGTEHNLASRSRRKYSLFTDGSNPNPRPEFSRGYSSVPSEDTTEYTGNNLDPMSDKEAGLYSELGKTINLAGPGLGGLGAG